MARPTHYRWVDVHPFNLKSFPIFNLRFDMFSEF